jgi:hypothetical protein
MTGLDHGRTSPFAERLLTIRGRMRFEVAMDGVSIDTTLPLPLARRIVDEGGINERATRTRDWLKAFSGRVPFGWESPRFVLADIADAVTNGDELSTDLVLAGITHPDKEVRDFTVSTRILTARELAVAIALNDYFWGQMAVIMQRRNGMTQSAIDEARSIAKRAVDGSVDMVDLMRGDF